MIKLGTNTYNDIFVLSVTGLYNFPKLKETGRDWSNENYIQPSSRAIDFQYGTRTIKLECIMSNETFSGLQSRIAFFINDLKQNDLKMLVVPDYSKRGYMVRLKNTTIFKPYYSTNDSKALAKFSVVFEEPQPLNVQFSFFSENGCIGTCSYGIAYALKSLSFNSLEQRYITICTDAGNIDINLEEENYFTSLSLTLKAGECYPVVVLGCIDRIDNIEASSNSSGIVVVGNDSKSLFIRN